MNSEGTPREAESPQPWKEESAETVASFKMFDVRRKRLRVPRNDAEVTFDIADSPDGVAVLATTSAGKLILVEQYRPALRSTFLELPAGVLEEGEDPVEAGLRELREETGYTAASGRAIGSLTLNPSWQTTRVQIVVCRDAHREAPPSLDEGEDVQVRLVDPQELQDMIARGEVDTAITIAALGLRSAGA